MTDKELLDLVALINTDPDNERVYTRAIATGVRFGVVFRGRAEPPQPDYPGPQEFFFIYDGSTCVAVIQGGHDMHGVVVEERRGQGVMSDALGRVVLPYLRARGEESVTMTFREDRVGVFLKRLGFEVTRQVAEVEHGKACKDLTTVEELPDMPRESLTKDRSDAIQEKLRQARRLVMEAEQEMSLLDDAQAEHADELEWLSGQVGRGRDQIAFDTPDSA